MAYCSFLYPASDAAGRAAGMQERRNICRLASCVFAALHWRCPGNPGARV